MKTDTFIHIFNLIELSLLIIFYVPLCIMYSNSQFDDLIFLPELAENWIKGPIINFYIPKNDKCENADDYLISEMWPGSKGGNCSKTCFYRPEDPLPYKVWRETKL